MHCNTFTLILATLLPETVLYQVFGLSRLLLVARIVRIPMKLLTILIPICLMIEQARAAMMAKIYHDYLRANTAGSTSVQAAPSGSVAAPVPAVAVSAHNT